MLWDFYLRAKFIIIVKIISRMFFSHPFPTFGINNPAIIPHTHHLQLCIGQEKSSPNLDQDSWPGSRCQAPAVPGSPRPFDTNIVDHWAAGFGIGSTDRAGCLRLPPVRLSSTSRSASELPSSLRDSVVRLECLESGRAVDIDGKRPFRVRSSKGSDGFTYEAVADTNWDEITIISRQ